MSDRRLALLFAALTLIVLVALAPLRLAVGELDDSGLSARRVSGTVWNGRLEGLAYGGAALGDADVGLQFWPLLVGMRRLDVEIAEGPASGRGVFDAGGRSEGLVDANARVQVGVLPLPVPMTGELRLEAVSVLFDDEGCRSAQGRVTTDALRRSAGLLRWTGPVLSGELACQNRALIAPLSGQEGATRVDVTLRFEPDGRYRAATRVLTSDVGLGAVLMLAGFQRTADGLSRTDEGRYRR